MPRLVLMAITVFLTQLRASPVLLVTTAKTEISITAQQANSVQEDLSHRDHALLDQFVQHRI